MRVTRGGSGWQAMVWRVLSVGALKRSASMSRKDTPFSVASLMRARSLKRSAGRYISLKTSNSSLTETDR